DKEWNERIGAAWASKPLYFKAGVYVQDNSSNTKEGAKVTFEKLDIDHE
ncbi:polysaccharide lyase family 7 protein, partial [Pseudomonas sp. SWRI 103]